MTEIKNDISNFKLEEHFPKLLEFFDDVKHFPSDKTKVNFTLCDNVLGLGVSISIKKNGLNYEQIVKNINSYIQDSAKEIGMYHFHLRIEVSNERETKQHKPQFSACIIEASKGTAYIYFNVSTTKVTQPTLIKNYQVFIKQADIAIEDYFKFSRQRIDFRDVLLFSMLDNQGLCNRKMIVMKYLKLFPENTMYSLTRCVAFEKGPCDFIYFNKNGDSFKTPLESQEQLKKYLEDECNNRYVQRLTKKERKEISDLKEMRDKYDRELKVKYSWLR